ncbi:TonB-dependent receptor domain-containing protein [Campylobacter sp. MG1]|uniref:TonB-dependent receptor domain-containing protein n=1 Tax=Campylobacter sp. MG1 TaxID=2976332 RepID=UPI00226D3A16|nr:TonB-dependent receptor [Campylobacter sp. MG1]
MKKSLKLSLVLCLMGGNISLAANENANLDTIEVNAESIGYNNFDSIKISNRNASNIRDVMRDIPGVYVGGTSNLNQKIYMRGMNEKGLNITIDGAREKGNIFHHSANLILDADMLKAVDVGVGVLSVVNNSGALGGSVAFKTVDATDLLEGDESFGGKIKSSFASNNKEWQKSLMLYGKTDIGFHALAYVKHSSYKFGKTPDGQRIGGTHGDDLNYLLKLGYDKDDHKIKFSYENTTYKGEYPLKGEFGITDTTDTFDQETPRKTAIFDYNYNPNDYVDFNFKAYITRHSLKHKKNNEQIFKDVANSKNKSASGSTRDSHVETKGLYINNKTILGSDDSFKHTLKYGLEYYTTSSFIDNIISYKATPTSIVKTKESDSPKDKVSNTSIYLEDTITYGNLNIIPGIRFDHYTMSNVGRGNTSFNNVSPALALDYKFNNGFNIFAGYAKVFRGPEPIETIKVSSGLVASLPGEDLKPETGNAYEVGFGYKNSFNEHNVSFMAKYFYTDYKNLIKELSTIEGQKTTLLRFNTNGAKVKGIELFAKYSYQDFSIGLGYTKQDTKYKDGVMVQGKGGSSLAKGDVLGYTDMGDKYTLNLEYFAAPIDTLFGYNFIAFAGKKLDDGTKRAGYGISDVYVSYMPSYVKNLEINLSVNNLFNKKYVSHTTRSATISSNTDWEAGRNIKLGFSYKF